MATFDNIEAHVRTELNDDDYANPVIDPIVMLKVIGDCYLNVAAILGVSPAKAAVVIAGLTEATAAAVQLAAIDTFLYSDGGITDMPLPKMDYEFIISMRGGRSIANLTQSRPRAFAAREIQGNTVKLYFDTKCPADATAQLWSVAQATRPTKGSDTVYLAETGIRALEAMSVSACFARLTAEQKQKLGIGDGVGAYNQGIVESLLNAEKGRAASIEQVSSIQQTED